MMKMLARCNRLVVALLFVTAAAAPLSTIAQDRDIRVSEYSLDEITYPDLPEFDIPEPERVELPNGLVVFLIEDRELPMINISARLGTGAVHEPAEKVGLASITGQVMRSGGTASMTPDELNVHLEGLGASVETGIGTESGSAFMRTLREHVDEVLPVFAEVLMNPAFDEEQVELAKTQQRSAISRRNDNPQQIAMREFSKVVYGADSPYARTPEYYTVDAIEREDLVAFHEEFFHPNNTILSVWGDFDVDEMIERIEAAFADWEVAPNFERPALPEVPAERNQTVHFIPKDDVTQSTILMGHVGLIDRSHPDYFATIVMNEVLSGGFTSRLFKNIRTDQGLAYAVFGQYSANYNRPGQFFAGVYTRSDATIRAVDAMMEVIESMHTDPPTEEEITLAKDSYLNSFVFNFDTRREIVDRLMTYEYYDYPSDFLERTREDVAAVTAEDVQRVAQRYLHPGEMHLLVLGKEEDFDQPIATLGEVNEIDITIPRTPPGESADAGPASEGDIAKGREVFNASVEALGGQEAFDAIETLRQSATQTVTGPGGQQVQISMDITIAGPERMRMVQSLPMGDITLLMTEDRILMETPQGEMEAPPQARDELNAQRWRSIAYLYAYGDRDDVEIVYDGEGEVNGQPAEILRITAPGTDSPFQLFVDQETHQPLAIEYEGMNPITQTPMQAREVFEDFRAVGELTLPHKSTAYADGEELAVTETEQIELNVPVEDSLFQP